LKDIALAPESQKPTNVEKTHTEVREIADS